MRRLVEGLVAEPADAGVTRDGLVVQYVAAVADGVDRDGANKAVLYIGEIKMKMEMGKKFISKDHHVRIHW